VVKILTESRGAIAYRPRLYCAGCKIANARGYPPDLHIKNYLNQFNRFSLINESDGNVTDRRTAADKKRFVYGVIELPIRKSHKLTSAAGYKAGKSIPSDPKQRQMKQKAASELTLYSSHGDISSRSYHDGWKRKFRGPLGGYSLTVGLIGPCLIISSLLRA